MRPVPWFRTDRLSLPGSKRVAFKMLTDKKRSTKMRINKREMSMFIIMLPFLVRGIEGGESHWGYQEGNGPENWQKTCQDGFRQVSEISCILVLQVNWLSGSSAVGAISSVET
ncbi:hypothetical protein COOONC_02102 [Cooperia oncophora]